MFFSFHPPISDVQLMLRVCGVIGHDHANEKQTKRLNRKIQTKSTDQPEQRHACYGKIMYHNYYHELTIT
jgi:hypothetical protein